MINVVRIVEREWINRHKNVTCLFAKECLEVWD